MPMCAVKTYLCRPYFDLSFHAISLFSCLFRTSESPLFRGSPVCGITCVSGFALHPLTSTPCTSQTNDNSPRGPTHNHVGTTNLGGARSRTYHSQVAPGRSPTPQPLRSPQLEDSDLRLIRAQHSQGHLFTQYQELSRDPASPERE